MFDIIAIGDSTVDVFLEIDDPAVSCDTTNHDHSKLALPYGSKIPVKKVTTVSGAGNAANHSVAASRLGKKVALYSVFGHDEYGHHIAANLKKEKVSSVYFSYDKKNPTNYSTILEFKGERTILGYHSERVYKLPRFSSSKWIFFSSISGNHESFNASLVKYIKKSGVKLAFSPGSMQMKLGLQKLLPIISHTEILFVNKEEGERLAGNKVDIKELLRALQLLGPTIVVVTDGQNGSYCFDGKTFFYAPIIDMPVLQRTGCGDAYAAGFLAAMVEHLTVLEAMRWGTINAAHVAANIGSQAGLLGKKKMIQELKKSRNFQPREL